MERLVSFLQQMLFDGVIKLFDLSAPYVVGKILDAGITKSSGSTRTRIVK